MSPILGSRFMVQMLLRKRNGMNKYAMLHAANLKAEIPNQKVKLVAAVGLKVTLQNRKGSCEKCVCVRA